MSCQTKTFKNKQLLKRKLYTYSEESLKQALQLIRGGQISIREASRKFRVPRTTLQDRLSGRCSDILKKTGPQPIMTTEGEKRIADWAIDIAKCGFPIKKEYLMETVTKIVHDTGSLTNS